MLVFSNVIIGYSTLFKNRETSWLLTLPVAHRNIYRWKFLESLLVSSWALFFLSAPLMAAYGTVHNVSPVFYIAIALSYVPFVVIPGLIGSCVILFLARAMASRWLKRAIFFAAVASVAAIVFAIKPVSESEAVRSQDVLAFDQLLRHTRVTLNPFLPSAWLARSVLSWSEGLVREG